MKKNVLLIRMGSREYLVPKTAFAELVEFAKTFSTEIYLVDVLEGWESILTLPGLANAVCNNEYKLAAKYAEIEKLFPCDTPKPNEHLVTQPQPPNQSDQAARRNRWTAIRAAIRQRFLEGKTVSASELMNQELSNYVINVASIRNHLSTVRNLLAGEGHTINKVGIGRYQLARPVAEKKVEPKPVASQRIITDVFNDMFDKTHEKIHEIGWYTN